MAAAAPQLSQLSPAPGAGSLAGLGDRLLIDILLCLGSSELARLECTAPRFAAKTWAPSNRTSISDSWSLCAEAARLKIASQSACEQRWVPRRDTESWPSLLAELESLLAPRVFTHAMGGYGFNRGATVDGFDSQGRGMDEYPPEMIEEFGEPEDPDYFAAIADVPMRAGRHYVEFKKSGGCMVGVAEEDFQYAMSGPGGLLKGVGDDGLMEAEYDQDSGLAGSHCALFNSSMGFALDEEGWRQHRTIRPIRNGRFFSSWPGEDATLAAIQAAKKEHVIGLLLDLDVGSLELYLDGKRMGLLVPTGIKGPMIWAADIGYDASVTIQSRPAPAAESLSPEQQAAEAAWLTRWPSELAKLDSRPAAQRGSSDNSDDDNEDSSESDSNDSSDSSDDSSDLPETDALHGE